MSETNPAAPQEGLKHNAFTENLKLSNTIDSPVNVKGNWSDVKGSFNSHLV